MPQQRLEIAYADSHTTPDLGSARDRGLDGLMIRLGQGGNLRDKSGKIDPYIDSGFLGHRLSALAIGMPYGVIYQCAALDEKTAEAEADWLVGQLSALRDEIGLYVALQVEDIPQFPRYYTIGKCATERILRIIAGRLTLEGFRVLIYATDRSLERCLTSAIFKTYGAYVVRHNIAERILRTDRRLRIVLWEYGESRLTEALGAICFGEIAPVALKRIRVTKAAAVRLIPGTRVYANAKDPRPCSILGQKMTRYVWSDKKKNGRYAVTLLAQFAEQPSRISCYVAERDVEIGILRERIDA